MGIPKTIEYSRTVLQINEDGLEERYLCFTELGNSRMVDSEGDVIRSVGLLYSGSHADVMRDIALSSSNFVDESMVLGSGPCDPESYIAKWRSALNNPLPLSEYLRYSYVEIGVFGKDFSPDRAVDGKTFYETECGKLIDSIKGLNGYIKDQIYGSANGLGGNCIFCFGITLENYKEFFSLYQRAEELFPMDVDYDCRNYSVAKYDVAVRQFLLAKQCG
jgi:hypothetical protein